MWYARPQLFFKCTLCPAGGAKGEGRMHKEVSLVYFSTFEPIELTPDSIMQRAGVPMLYDSASNQRLPCFYICPAGSRWQTCLGGPLSFLASSAATVTPRSHCDSHTASRTIGVLETPPPTRNGTGAMAAGSTR